MRVFRDRRADSDRSLRLGWTIFVWLMTRQLVSDVDLVQQAELEGDCERGRARVSEANDGEGVMVSSGGLTVAEGTMSADGWNAPTFVALAGFITSAPPRVMVSTRKARNQKV